MMPHLTLTRSMKTISGSPASTSTWGRRWTVAFTWRRILKEGCWKVMEAHLVQLDENYFAAQYLVAQYPHLWSNFLKIFFSRLIDKPVSNSETFLFIMFHPTYLWYNEGTETCVIVTSSKSAKRANVEVLRPFALLQAFKFLYSTLEFGSISWIVFIPRRKHHLPPVIMT